MDERQANSADATNSANSINSANWATSRVQHHRSVNHTSTRNFTASDTKTAEENICHVSISANVTVIDCSDEAVPAEGSLEQQLKAREIKIQTENVNNC